MLEVPVRSRATLLSLVVATIVTIPLAISVYRVPVQVSDSLEPLVIARKAESTVSLLKNSATFSPTTFRPSRYLQARWLLQLADDVGASYNVVFRSVHVALLCVLVLLFVVAVRVRTWDDVVAFSVALPVLIGIHTFVAMLLEAFPVNHYAEVSVCALAVFVLAQHRPRPYVPLVASVLLVLALSVIESGAMVWITVVCCAAAGLPGIKRPTVVITTILFAAYLVLRHRLGIASPGIGGHGSGFGATFYSAEEIAQRFGPRPLAFMIYNVIGGLASLLFSEPRNGVYSLLMTWRSGELHPVVAINILSSLVTTLLLIWFAVTHLRTRRATWSDDTRAFAAAVGVMLVNTALTAAYIKDEIISVGGVLYAVGTFIAVRALVQKMPRQTFASALTIALLLTGDAALWTFRAVGVHYQLRYDAFKTRNDWTEVLRQDKRSDWPEDPRELELTRRLRSEALERQTTSPSFMPKWGDRYWVE